MTASDKLEGCVRRAALALRLRRSLQAAVFGSLAALGLLVVVSLGAWWLGHARAASLVLGSVLLALAITPALVAAAWPVSRSELLRAIDRSHGFDDLLSSAWWFLQRPREEHTPFMRATLEAAERAAANVEIARTRIGPRARGLLWLPGLALLALLMRFLPGPAIAPVARLERPVQLVRPERLLSAQDASAYRTSLARSESEPGVGPTVSAVRSELERMIERVLAGPLDRISALRQLRALDQRLDAVRSDAERAREALQLLAARLAVHSATRALGAQLRQDDLTRAREELDHLSRQLREAGGAARQRESLEAALRDARAVRPTAGDPHRGGLAAQPRVTARDALDDPERSADPAQQIGASAGGADSAPENSGRARDTEQQVGSSEQGYETLAARPGAESAEPVGSRSSTDVPATPGAPETSGPGDGEPLDPKLSEHAAAAGEKPTPEDPGIHGNSARTLERLERDLDQTERALGEDRVPQAATALERAAQTLQALQAERAEATQAAALRERIEGLRESLRRGARSRRADSNPGQTQKDALARASGPDSPEGPGTGPRRAQPSGAAELQITPSYVAGTPVPGPTRSQVILGAASGGFIGSDYARVHAEYARHAERELEREPIPPGYRFYVRRYFESIAPPPATGAP